MKNRRTGKGILILIIMMIMASLAGCATTNTSSVDTNALAVTAEDANATVIAISQVEESQSSTDQSLIVTTGDSFEAVDVRDLEDALAKVDAEVNVENWEVEGRIVEQDQEEEFIQIESAGVYILEGSYTEQILVDSQEEGDVVLVLNGVQLTNAETSPIFVSDADRLVIVLAEGTENTIIDTSAYTEETDSEEERLNGAIYSKSDLVFTGTGSVEIEATDKSGILAKDAIVVLNGEIVIEAARNGIKVNDLFYMVAGQVQIDAEKDGIQSEAHMQIENGTIIIDSMEDALHAEGMIVINDGEFHLETEDDGIRADEYLEVNGGSIAIPVCYEGLESMVIVINDGMIELIASDDGINVADTSVTAENSGFDMGPGDETPIEGAALVINGGEITISSGGDGVDSNGSGFINGGSLLIDGPGNGGDVGLDFNDPLVIEGGFIISVGNDGAAFSFSEAASQNVLQVFFDEVMAAGSQVTVIGQDGELLMAHTSIKTYGVLVFSSEGLNQGEVVTVKIDGEIVEEVTISDTITIVGTSLVGEGPGTGNRPGGGINDQMAPPDGEVPEGEMSEGGRPEGNRPEGNRPEGGRPDMNQTTIPQAEAGSAATETTESKG